MKIISFLVLASLLCSAPPLFADAGTILRAGHLVDPASGETIADQLLHVDADGKITATGPDTAIPDDADVVDLSSAWVLPGLMDAHHHLTFGLKPRDGAPGATALFFRESTGLRALRGIHNGRVILEGGFTTVKEIGNAGNYADTDMRVALERGWFDGPTIINAGKIIAPFGGQVKHIAYEHGPLWQFEYIDATGPHEIRKAVRRNIYYGAKTIKLVADAQVSYYSEDEIRAAVDEAHRAGLKVAVHVVRDAPARAVILGGAAAIEHGTYLSDDVLELMKEKGTVLVGTDFPADHMAAISGDRGRRVAAVFHDRLKRAYKIGVPMVFGTDVAVDIPDRNRADLMFDYLDVWLDAGIPPPAILKAMTTDAALLLGVDEERGFLRPGLMADVIAVPKNPLEDIHTLRDVCFVMKNGKIIKSHCAPQ